MTELGVQSLAEMRTDGFGLLRVPSSSFLISKFDAAINRTYEMIVKTHGPWPTLEKVDEIGLKSPSDTTDDTILSGAGFAPLPWGCRNVTSMFLHSPERQEVKETSPSEMARKYSTTTTGSPRWYSVAGDTAQYKELAATGTIVVLGDAVNDSVATARIWYRTQAGHLGEVVSPLLSGSFSTGVTPTLAASAGWPIERITVDSKWAGDITVQSTTGSVELVKASTAFTTASSNPYFRVATRPLIRLAPTPDTDYKATVIWKRVPRRLIKADDVPEIPVSSALVYGAVADILRSERRYPQANQMEGKKLEALGAAGSGEQAQGGMAAPMWGNFLDATGVGL